MSAGQLQVLLHQSPAGRLLTSEQSWVEQAAFCSVHNVYTNVYMLYMYTSYERARVQCTAIVPRAKRMRNCDPALTSNHDAIDPSLLQAPLCISQELYVAVSKHWNVHTASARSRCRNEHYLINSYKY